MEANGLLSVPATVLQEEYHYMLRKKLEDLLG
jgi:hypothetical protein